MLMSEAGGPAGRSQRPAEQIDRAVSALPTLAFDLAVARQPIEPRAGLAIIEGADQPRYRRAGYPSRPPCSSHALLQKRRWVHAESYTMATPPNRAATGSHSDQAC